jgi:transcription initiation factor TFIIH subunit 2
VMGSLTTCDPGDINTAIEECKKHNIRCSAIGLAAEVHLCKKMCAELRGIYSVIIDEQHLDETFQKIAFPLPNSV